MPLKKTPKCLWARLSSSGRKVVVMNWAEEDCWQITLAMARLQGGVRRKRILSRCYLKSVSSAASTSSKR